MSAESSGSISEAVAKVDGQLSAFWAKAPDGDGAVTARAATMNFVALCASHDVDEVRERIEKLAETRAGRAFLLTVSGSIAPWGLDTDVSSVCLKQGDIIVCYDRIEFVFGAMVAPRAASVVSALALSEVPTIVEVGRGAAPTLVDAFARIATRWIVDTAHTPLSRLGELAKKSPAPFGDRAFVRSFTWRELVARFFDEARGAERAIGRIEIERAPEGGSDPAALVLGWLASRLGWHFTSASSATDAQGNPIEISVKAANAIDAGEIGAVRLVAVFEGRPLFCSLERRGADRMVSYRVAGTRRASHEVPLGFRDEAWVLGKAIDSVEADRVYREALLQAVEWVKLAQPSVEGAHSAQGAAR